MGLSLHARPCSSEKEGGKEREEEEERTVRRKERGTIVVVVGSPNEFKYLNYKSLRGRASFMAAPR